MGLLDFLFGTAIAMNILDTRGPKRTRGPAPADDEAEFDDGYPDDHVGDGLDGTDDYVGDGLDGPDVCEDDPE
ncbi:MAG: hypothetical protein J5806_11450 [Lentisphaeria bacterium]|nr:hypothetical protein [Lentisphaeria bacterium]